MLRSASKLTLCGAIFDAPSKVAEMKALEEVVSAPGFWDQPEKSQKILQARKRLEEFVTKDSEVAARVSDIDTLFTLGREGENVTAELESEIRKFTGVLQTMEDGMLLAGENDSLSAIITIHPGAGGTESQDWAEMLERLYLRWAERKGMHTTITDRLDGEAAGIKSVTFEVNGENAFGLLQSEVGVHRLVRISPFDSNARRHTSFASVFVFPQIDDDIKIDIKPEELRVDVFRASGAGGQHVNRTESAVRMTHLPTGLVVQCQNERSQHKNRATAIKQLRARLYEHEMNKRRAEEKKLEDSKADINFGSQIRSYVLAPYRLIKDHRTKLAVGDVDRVLDGDLDDLIHAWLVFRRTGKTAGDGKDDLPE
ncbi:MAG: peptide chain release factor 2 [Acidobacteriia bacterium]|nr:peptide chain release factor 2 [Terriglobia bacterium]